MYMCPPPCSTPSLFLLRLAGAILCSLPSFLASRVYFSFRSVSQCLFTAAEDPDDAKAAIGVCDARGNCSVYSKPLPLSALYSTELSPLSVPVKEHECTYELAYGFSTLPGVFNETRLLTIFPRFIVSNITDEWLQLRQRGANALFVSTVQVISFGLSFFPGRPSSHLYHSRILCYCLNCCR